MLTTSKDCIKSTKKFHNSVILHLQVHKKLTAKINKKLLIKI